MYIKVNFRRRILVVHYSRKNLHDFMFTYEPFYLSTPKTECSNIAQKLFCTRE